MRLVVLAADIVAFRFQSVDKGGKVVDEIVSLDIVSCVLINFALAASHLLAVMHCLLHAHLAERVKAVSKIIGLLVFMVEWSVAERAM